MVVRGVAQGLQQAYVQAIRRMARRYRRAPANCTAEQVQEYPQSLVREHHLCSRRCCEDTPGRQRFHGQTKKMP
ncbi:phage integrase N-terminal SAM-like domain-containing protein [Paracidovorax sp. MALMAid1276]|uniref:phage integrase N-terminal SAM-like domain-containing protein n=1 Tax=Paracidovorax sp. MALMAid1276 TaxID=3411631 RepID=UPI003B9C9250